MSISVMIALLSMLGIGACAIMCLAHMIRSSREINQQLQVSAFIHGARSNKLQTSPSDKKTTKADKRLMQAGISISSYKWYGTIISICVLAFALFALRGMIVIAALFAGITFAASEIVIATKAKKRRRLFDEQLARALPQIAENLRSGLSIEQASRSVARISSEPLASELNRINAETSFSSDFSTALERSANRIGSNDIALLALATRISKEQGGSIAATLDQVAETVDTRQAMRRHCNSATSSTKLSAWVMVGMLLVVFIGLSFLQEGFLDFYLSQTLGWICAACALLLVCAGIFFIYQLSDIKLD